MMKFLSKNILLKIFLNGMTQRRFVSFLPVMALYSFLLSCSNTLPPLIYPSKNEPALIERLGGGIKPPELPALVLPEAQIKQRIKTNAEVPIDYLTGFAGGINLQTRLQEAWDILSPPIGGDYRLTIPFIYKEGLVVKWREQYPRTPTYILLDTNYKGTMDFGPWMGEARYQTLGDSFSKWFEEETTQKLQVFFSSISENTFIVNKIFLLTVFTSISDITWIPQEIQEELKPHLREFKNDLRPDIDMQNIDEILKMLAPIEINRLIRKLQPVDFSKIQNEISVKLQEAEQQTISQIEQATSQAEQQNIIKEEFYQKIKEIIEFYHQQASEVLIFNETQAIFNEDQKATRFIIEIYKHLENTDQNCIDANLCSIVLETFKCPFVNAPPIRLIVFKLPKMSFYFSPDKKNLQYIRIHLNHPLTPNSKIESISMMGNLCAVASMSKIHTPIDNMYFDLSRLEFFGEDLLLTDSPPLTVGFTDSYKESAQVFDIPQFFPLSLSHNRFIHKFENHHIHLGWSRNPLDETSRGIPENSPLSEVILKKDYSNLVFMNRSLIKVHFGFLEDLTDLLSFLENSQSEVKVDEVTSRLDISIKIALDPLNEKALLADIEQKQSNIKEEENHFYFSSNLPQVKPVKDDSGGWKLILDVDDSHTTHNPPETISRITDLVNFNLQHHFMWEFATFFEEHFAALHPEQNIRFDTLVKKEENPHKSFISLKAIFEENQEGFHLQSSVEHSSGIMAFKISLIEGDFERYIIEQQQASVDMDISKTPFRPGGFAIGDKIYLRQPENTPTNKRFVIYPLLEENNYLATLASYNDQPDSINYERQNFKIKGEHITIDGIEFLIQPENTTTQIQGKTYEDYKIIAFIIESHLITNGVKNICGQQELSINREDQKARDLLKFKLDHARQTLTSNTHPDPLPIKDPDSIDCILSYQFNPAEQTPSENNESYLIFPFYNISIKFKEGYFSTIMFYSTLQEIKEGSL